MLLMNQRINKLTAARTDFKAQQMLDGTCLSATLQAILAEMTAEENVDAETDAAAEQPLDEDSDETTKMMLLVW